MKYEMTYADFSRYLANHGFPENPVPCSMKSCRVPGSPSPTFTVSPAT